MSERITVTGQIPEEGGSPGFVSTTPIVTEIRVVNMLADIGKLVLHLGHSSIALTPQQWDVVLNCLVDAVGPTRSLNLPPMTIAEKLDAAAAVDDNGEAFGAALNGFIGALGRAK
jgi:hypothetical protein